MRLLSEDQPLKVFWKILLQNTNVFILPPDSGNGTAPEAERTPADISSSVALSAHPDRESAYCSSREEGDVWCCTTSVSLCWILTLSIATRCSPHVYGETYRGSQQVQHSLEFTEVRRSRLRIYITSISGWTI